MGVFFRTKQERKEDKILKEYYDELDKMEKEEEKKDKIKFKDLFKKDPFDEELRSYMTPEQLEEERKDKKRVKIINISLVVVILLIAGGIIGTTIFLSRQFASDLDKIDKKEIISFYKKEFGTDLKVKSIDYYCKDKEKPECINHVVVKTDKGEEIHKVDGIIYDSIHNEYVYTAYDDYIHNINESMQLFFNNPVIADVDFNEKYNIFEESINVFPVKGDFHDLVDNNKIIISDVLIYQGELNEEAILDFLNKLNDQSKFIFIRTENATPKEVHYFSKENHIVVSITGKTKINDYFDQYTLDPNSSTNYQLSITEPILTEMKMLEENTYFSKAFEITLGKNNYGRRNNNGNFNYYILSYNGPLDQKSIKQFNKDNELVSKNYTNLYTVQFNGKTFLLCDKAVSFGTIERSK